MERVGFWRRAAAVGLDTLFGGVAVVAAASVAGVASVLGDAPEALTDYVAGVTAGAVVLAYTSTDVWLAATPGKLVLGLRIGTSAGTPAPKWTLALRWTSKYFGAFVYLIYAITLSPAVSYLGGFMNNVVIVGCLQALDEHRRAWHDEWAGTAVYRHRDLLAFGGPATPPPLPRASTEAVSGADDGRRV